MADIQKIEERVDRTVTAATVVNEELGGLALSNMLEVMEFAKLMSVSGAAVPRWLRGNPGGCLAICTRALRWKMDQFYVAEKSYLVNNKGEERIAFESQLIHAVIEARAPLKNRLRHEIIGAGDDRKCHVWGTFKGEDKPHEFLSETLGKRIKDIGRNDQGKIKGSPLWDIKPELQLFYDATRDWARMHASDVLAGVYTIDELPDAVPIDVSPDAAKPATALTTLTQRLVEKKKAAASRGFDADHVERQAGAHAGNTILDGHVNSDETITAESGSDGEEKDDGSTAGGHDDGLRSSAGSTDGSSAIQVGDEGASASGDRSANEDDRSSTGGGPENEEDTQGDIFPADRTDPGFPKPRNKRK